MAIKIYIQKRPSIVVQVGAKVINAGGGGVQTVTGDGVNNIDPLNPVLSFPTPAQIGAPAGSGNSTGTNTGDQTITLTGDVTGSGTGAFAATIANDAVTFEKMQNISTGHLIGRHAAGNGDPELIGLDGGVEFQGSKLRAKVANSVELNGGNIQLLNDSATPGNSKYYGTNAAGNKGFYDLPSGSLLPFDSTPILIVGTPFVGRYLIKSIPVPTNIGNCALRVTAFARKVTQVSGADQLQFFLGTVATPNQAQILASTQISLGSNNSTLNLGNGLQRTFPVRGGSSGSITVLSSGNLPFDFAGNPVTCTVINVDWTIQRYIYIVMVLGDSGNVMECYGHGVETI